MIRICEYKKFPYHLKNIFGLFTVLTFALITLSTSTPLDEFTWNFYKIQASSNEAKNMIISPSSLSQVLGMSMFGATGETRSEIERHLSGVDFKDLTSKINRESAVKSGERRKNWENLSEIYFLANKIYLANQYTIKPSFRAVASSKFQSSAETVNFGNGRDTANLINQWIENMTDGVLKNVVKPASLNFDVKMLLLNAIYFKGTWVNGFNLNKNPRYMRNFYKTQDEIIKLNFMETDEKKFKFAQNDELKVQIIELPYANTSVKMYILLPSFESGVIELERSLNARKFNDLIKSMNLTDATVAMPKIKLDSDVSFNEPLKKVEIDEIFEFLIILN